MQKSVEKLTYKYYKTPEYYFLKYNTCMFRGRGPQECLLMKNK